jgi:hypothetical protein
MSDPIQLYDNPTKAARAFLKTLVFQGSTHYVTGNKFSNIETGANMLITSMLTEFIVRDKIISTTGIASRDLNKRIALDMILTIIQFYLGQYVYDGKMSLSDVIVCVVTSDVFASFGDFVAINAATGNTWYNTASDAASVVNDIVQGATDQIGVNKKAILAQVGAAAISWIGATRGIASRLRIGNDYHRNQIENGQIVELP